MTAAARDARYRRLLDPDGPDALARIARRLPAGSTVLDVGTGPGALGQWLSARGGLVDGLEVDPGRAAEARPHYRRLCRVDLETEDWPAQLGERYDRVVCADVLEHLREPGVLLDRLHAVLAPGGRVLLSVPNVGYAGVVAELLAGDFRYRPEGVLDATHLRFFTRRSLLELLAAHGWRPCRVEAIVRDLHDSEFRAHRLEALPPALVRHLAARPDALAYQFVVEAEPGRAGATERLPASSAAPGLDGFVAQLYWRARGADYSEARSVRAVGRIGEAPQTLRFPLPADVAPVALRLDPADRPGFLRLYALRLRAADGAVVWAWDGTAAALNGAERRALAVTAGVTGNRHAVCRLEDDDPSLCLPIPPTALRRGAPGGTLELEASWPLSPDYRAFERHRTQRLRAGLRNARGRGVMRLRPWLERCQAWLARRPGARRMNRATR